MTEQTYVGTNAIAEEPQYLTEQMLESKRLDVRKHLNRAIEINDIMSGRRPASHEKPQASNEEQRFDMSLMHIMGALEDVHDAIKNTINDLTGYADEWEIITFMEMSTKLDDWIIEQEAKMDARGVNEAVNMDIILEVMGTISDNLLSVIQWHKNYQSDLLFARTGDPAMLE